MTLVAMFAAITLCDNGFGPGGDDGDYEVVGFVVIVGFVVGAGAAVGYWVEGRFGGRGWRRAWEAGPTERPGD